MTSINITAKDFRDLVSPVLPMVADTDLSVLACVRIQSHDGWLTATATDRFRLGVQRLAKADAVPGVDALVRAADVRRILSIFKPGRRENPELVLTFEDRNLSVEAGSTLGFGFDNARIGFSLMDGDYPDVYSLIKTAMVVPARVGGASFNPRFLGEIPHDGSHAISVWMGADIRKPALVASENFIGVIMPRRLLDGIDRGEPDKPDDWGFLLDAKPVEAVA